MAKIQIVFAHANGKKESKIFKKAANELDAINQLLKNVQVKKIYSIHEAKEKQILEDVTEKENAVINWLAQ